MNAGFLFKRFLVAACVAFAVLFAVELMKGHGTDAALRFAAMWGVVTSAVYVVALMYRLRRGAECQRNDGHD